MPNYTVPYFEHVIIVIQENRTTDNLFGAAAQTPYPSTLPTLDVSKYDLKLPPPQAPGGCTGTGCNPIPISSCLGTCFDPNHGNLNWQSQDGLLNGNGYNACATGKGGLTNSCPQTAQGGCSNPDKEGNCFICNGQNNGNYWVPPGCPQETYVDPTYDIGQADFGSNPPVYPYFDIAAKYGFANYFFQTNQGPSSRRTTFCSAGPRHRLARTRQAALGTGRTTRRSRPRISPLRQPKRQRGMGTATTTRI